MQKPLIVMEPASGIEPPTCGLRIALKLAPVQQIKDLAMQRKANSGNWFAIPQLTATGSSPGNMRSGGTLGVGGYPGS